MTMLANKEKNASLFIVPRLKLVLSGSVYQKYFIRVAAFHGIVFLIVFIAKHPNLRVKELFTISANHSSHSPLEPKGHDVTSLTLTFCYSFNMRYLILADFLKRGLLHNLSDENEFYLHVNENLFSYEKLCTKTHSEKEVYLGNDLFCVTCHCSTNPTLSWQPYPDRHFLKF